MLRSLLKLVLFYWLPLLLYITLLKFLSSQSHLPAGPDIQGFDKVEHVTAFAILGFLWARGIHSVLDLRRGSLVLVAFWGCLLYGLFDEFLIQAHTPGRDPSVWDLTADVIGGTLGGWAFIKMLLWQRFSRITG